MKETFNQKFSHIFDQNINQNIVLLFEDGSDIQLGKPWFLDINYYLSRYKIDIDNPLPPWFVSAHLLYDRAY